MNTENKLNVTASGEKLLLVNDVIKLEDKTTETFTAINPEHLNKYLETLGENIELFVSNQDVEVYNQERDGRYTDPLAKCKIEKHPIIQVLQNQNGKPQLLKDFVVFLERLKNYATPEALSLRDNISDLKIKKIISVENKNDKRGNYNFAVKAESGGKQDYAFPQSVKFNIPFVKGLSGTADEVEFNFYFQWENVGDNVELKFTLENLEFNQIVEETIVEMLGTLFDDKTVHYGSFSINKQTDEWQYKRNELQIRQ